MAVPKAEGRKALLSQLEAVPILAKKMDDADLQAVPLPPDGDLSVRLYDKRGFAFVVTGGASRKDFLGRGDDYVLDEVSDFVAENDRVGPGDIRTVIARYDVQEHLGSWRIGPPVAWLAKTRVGLHLKELFFDPPRWYRLRCAWAFSIDQDGRIERRELAVFTLVFHFVDGKFDVYWVPVATRVVEGTL